MMPTPNLKVALIHDELVRRGGAEIVFEELIRLFPQADVYSVYASNRPVVSVESKRYLVKTSSLQRLPLWFRRHPSRMLPLLMYAAERFDFSQYDLVISSSSGFAKAIITRASIPHISYCHTPTRYLWDATHEVAKNQGRGQRLIGKWILHWLRMADFAGAQRPDVMVANSHYTQQRIARTYRRESEVVYPPIDTTFYTPSTTKALTKKGSASFIVVGRLTPTKHIEHAIIACEKLGLPLTIIGTGSDEHRLRGFARKHTTFLGRQTPEAVRSHVRSARAFLQPGIEDFGMASAEALSCGVPVIGYGEGGIKEIVTSGKHGILYTSQQPEALAEAIHTFLAVEGRFGVEEMQKQAWQFSRYRFADSMMAVVNKTLQNEPKKP